MNRYAVLVGLGAALGLWQVIQTAPPALAARRARQGLALLLGGLLGARLGYVLLHFAYYRQHLLEAPQLWLGGLYWPGALAGALLALPVIARASGERLVVLADGLTPLLPPFTILVWLACWTAGCAYGIHTQGAWWGLPAADETGVVARRLPLQVLAALTLALMYGALELRLPPAPAILAGEKACLTLLALMTHTFLFSLLRADPTLRWLGLRADSWAALAFALPALAGWIILRLRLGKIESPPPKTEEH